MKTKSKQPITSRTDFFYYMFRNILLVGLPLLTVSALLLSFSRTFADNSTADNVSFEIPSSCTLSSVLNSDHIATVINGQYISDVGTTTIKTLCNDSNGFSIYTTGASNSTEGNNKLISSVSSQYDIATGTTGLVRSSVLATRGTCTSSIAVSTRPAATAGAAGGPYAVWLAKLDFFAKYTIIIE